MTFVSAEDGTEKSCLCTSLVPPFISFLWSECFILRYGHSLTSWHYCDVIMGTVASLITSLTIVYSTVCSDADQSKHQSSASLAFVRGIHQELVNSPYKWPVMRKMFPFDDIIMAWKHFSHYWSLVKGTHWSLMDFPHKGSIRQSFGVFFVVSLNKLLNK